MHSSLPKQHNFFDIDCSGEQRLVKLTLQGFHTSTNYRAAWNQSLKLAVRQGYNNWLVDFTHFRGSYNRDLEWSFGEWLEKANWDLRLSGGNYPCRVAILLSDDLITEFIIKSCLDSTQNYRDKACISIFKDTSEARKFLKA